MTGDLAARVVAAYTTSGLTIATAESLTGGLLGATVTALPGASAVYRGGLIAYATSAKATVAGLDEAMLAKHGAVSAWAVEHLARAAARLFDAEVGIALSGVAGPDPQEGHPAGTVWLGWAYAGQTGSRLLALGGDRATIRLAAVDAALDQLHDLAG